MAQKQSDAVDGDDLSLIRDDSPWLAVADLVGMGEVTVTIEDVKVLKDIAFPSGPAKKKANVLTFKGSKKGLILNVGNQVALFAKLGRSRKNWIGQQITLYLDPNQKQVGGGRGPGIRVKV